MEAPLALYLLGPPRVERDAVPVKLDRRKAMALVAYLAVTGESHRRDSLVNLLWPEYDSSRGRAALRRTLYSLRNALGTAWLAADRDQIGLDPSIAPWVDVDQFHQHLAACETHGHPSSEVCPTCVDPLADAVALVGGEFMSGFGLKDSVNFDDWQLLQAELLHRELDSALQRLGHWHSTQREFEPAVGYARRRLALDPLDEQAHCQLMRLYTWSGRRSTALRQYQECVEILKNQLGVPPQEATTQLYQAIQEGRAPPPPDGRWEQETPAHPKQIPLAPAEPPSFLEEDIPIEVPLFVARERELAQLDRYLQAALNGQGKVVFVTGEAGAGKTAIIQEFARRAQDSHPDLVIAAGHSNAHTGVGDPFLPFREILGLLTGDVKARWAAGAMTREQARRLWSTLPLTAQALVETGPDLIHTFILGTTLLRRARTVAPGGATWLTHLKELVEQKPVTRLGVAGPQQNDLFEQYTRILQVLAQQGPVILVLDDLQWADLGSISLLFHLGRQLAGDRILVVGAYRPEEVALGRVDPRTGSGQRERHPLEAVVNELQRDLGDITVNLGQDEGQRFIEALLQSEPNRLGDAFKEMLYRQTQGHPLFTIELLRGLQDQGDLVQDKEGYWIEGTALDWERLPARVEAVVAERIGRLAQPLRAALRVACVEGEVFTAEVVARVHASDEQGLLRSLSRELDKRHRLIRAQSVQRTAGHLVSRYRFRHGLFQRYLYSSLDQVERTHLHDQVGTALEELFGLQEESAATADIGEIAPQLARHFQEARNAEKAIHYLLLAGERAVQLSAYQEAVAHLTGGLALLRSRPDSPERARQELALQLALGMAWVGTKGYGPEAKDVYTRAHELARQMGDTSALCRVAGELSILYYVWAEHQRAGKLAEEALGLAQQSGDPLLIAVAHSYLGFVLFALGEYTTARAHLQQVIAFYSPEQHHGSLVALRGSDVGLAALAYDACCLWCLGYPDQAAERSEEALALARELGHPFTLADVLAFGCLFNEMRQNAHASTTSAEELKRLATEKVPGWLASATWYWGGALALQGHLDDGIAEMRRGLENQQWGSERCYRTGSICALARAQGKAGHPEDALGTLAEALVQVEQTGERYCEAEIYRVKSELLLAQGDEAGVAASLHKALDVARHQQAKSWELRATTSLARLWQAQGRAEEAREALAEVYGWFSEGFDTPDLKKAKALLEELS